MIHILHITVERSPILGFLTQLAIHISSTLEWRKPKKYRHLRP